MLIARKIYTIKDLLVEAGVPLDETKDISIGGLIFSSLNKKVRIPDTNPVVIATGRKEYKVEVMEAE